MKYETPNMDILIYGTTEIVRTSNLDNAGAGSGPAVEEDDWT